MVRFGADDVPSTSVSLSRKTQSSSFWFLSQDSYSKLDLRLTVIVAGNSLWHFDYSMHLVTLFNYIFSGGGAMWYMFV